MKKKLKSILPALCAVLLLSLFVWRLCPRSLESISGLDFDQAISLEAIIRTFDTSVLNGRAIDGEDATPGGAHYDNLLAQFKEVRARPSLTNFLRPWLLSGFHWTGPVTQLMGFVSCGDSASMFTLTDRGELIVGRYLYFITDEEQFQALWQYVSTYGAKDYS